MLTDSERKERINKVKRLAQEVGVLKDILKAKSMIFDCEAKETVAKGLGKPIDAFYNTSFKNWIKIKNKFYK